MRASLRLAAAEMIQEKMRINFPEYDFYDKKMKGDEPGLLRYRHSVGRNFDCYVVFRLLDVEAVECYLGWSNKGRCNLFSAHSGESDTSANLDELMVPLIEVSNRSGASHWSFWNPSDDLLDSPEEYAKQFTIQELRVFNHEQARDFVRQAVDAVFEELIEYGVPFLKRKIDTLL